MSKKGVTQVDWIISLVIFILYLAWFFVYLRPITQPTVDMDGMISNIIAEFERNTSWTVSVTPLFITSNVTSTEALRVPFPFSADKFALRDNHSYALSHGALFMSLPLQTGNNVIAVVRSSQNYSQPSVAHDLLASEDRASVNSKSFAVEYRDAQLSRLDYTGITRIRGTEMALNDEQIVPQTPASLIQPLLASYFYDAGSFNHTSHIMADHALVMNVVTPRALAVNQAITFSARLDNYTAYHVDNSDTGPLDFLTDECQSRTSRFIRFTNEDSGITFIFPDQTNITHCTDEEGLSLDADMVLSSAIQYDIILHDARTNDTRRYLDHYASIFGLAVNASGASSDLLSSLNNSDYADVKNRWNIPRGRDFHIEFLNLSGDAAYSIGAQPPRDVNVFVREKDLVTIDRFGRRSVQKVRARGW